MFPYGLYFGSICYKHLKDGEYARVAHIMRSAMKHGVVSDWRTCILLHYTVDDLFANG